VPGRQPGRDPQPVARWADGLLGVGWIVLVALGLVASTIVLALAVVAIVGGE
jgi:hypothetical protein